MVVESKVRCCTHEMCSVFLSLTSLSLKKSDSIRIYPAVCNVKAKSVQCISPDCECDQSCKTDMSIQNGEDQLPDHFGEKTEYSLPLDYMTIELPEDTTNIEARSVKCISPDCECDQSCRTDMPITNRKMDFSPNDHTSKRDTKTKGFKNPPTTHEPTNPRPTREELSGEQATEKAKPLWEHKPLNPEAQPFLPQTALTSHRPGKSRLNIQTKTTNSEKHGQEKPTQPLSQDRRPEIKHSNLNKAGHQEPGLVGLQSGIQDHRTQDQALYLKDLSQQTLKEPRPMATQESSNTTRNARPRKIRQASPSRESQPREPKSERPDQGATVRRPDHVGVTITKPKPRKPKQKEKGQPPKATKPKHDVHDLQTRTINADPKGQPHETQDRTQKIERLRERTPREKPLTGCPSQSTKARESRSRHKSRGANSKKRKDTSKPENQGQITNPKQPKLEHYEQGTTNRTPEPSSLTHSTNTNRPHTRNPVNTIKTQQIRPLLGTPPTRYRQK